MVGQEGGSYRGHELTVIGCQRAVETVLSVDSGDIPVN